MFEFMRLPASTPPVTVAQLRDRLRARLQSGDVLHAMPLRVHRCRATGLPAETATMGTDQVDELLFCLVGGRLICTLRSHSQLGSDLLDRLEEDDEGFDCWVARSAALIVRMTA